MAKRKRFSNMQRKKDEHWSNNTVDLIEDYKPVDSKVNEYHCHECGQVMTTVQRGDAVNGTTPMMISCQITDGCQGTMYSAMYRVPQLALLATHEWYIPKKLPKDAAMRQHVKMGGLMLRVKIDKSKDKR